MGRAIQSARNTQSLYTGRNYCQTDWPAVVIDAAPLPVARRPAIDWSYMLQNQHKLSSPALADSFSILRAAPTPVTILHQVPNHKQHCWQKFRKRANFDNHRSTAPKAINTRDSNGITGLRNRPSSKSFNPRMYLAAAVHGVHSRYPITEQNMVSK